mmetsp:Transcript_75526/g.191666  ORF Transcript_75526/g.191666 Transcript_75526/m.191666 type:complete len:215 (-) Transcript_75526:193-837(-)
MQHLLGSAAAATLAVPGLHSTAGLDAINAQGGCGVGAAGRLGGDEAQLRTIGHAQRQAEDEGIGLVLRVALAHALRGLLRAQRRRRGLAAACREGRRAEAQCVHQPQPLGRMPRRNRRRKPFHRRGGPGHVLEARRAVHGNLAARPCWDGRPKRRGLEKLPRRQRGCGRRSPPSRRCRRRRRFGEERIGEEPQLGRYAGNRLLQRIVLRLQRLL